VLSGFAQEQAIVITMAASSAATGRVGRRCGLARPTPTLRLLVSPDQESATYQVNTMPAGERSKLGQEGLGNPLRQLRVAPSAVHAQAC
jgi:hypothetical protein